MCPTDAIKYGTKNSNAGTSQDGGIGQHVQVDFVKYLKWDYTQPEVESIYSIADLDEAFLSKFFETWDVPVQEEQDCWHCGWPWSSRHRCPAWGVKCHRCGLSNHYARMCHTGSEEQASNADDSSETTSTTHTKKRPHRKRKKTAKQRLRDQERLQTFLTKKAMEQELLEKGFQVEELDDIVGTVAAALVQGDEELAHAGEWESAKMNKIHEAAMLDTTSSTSKEVDEMNSNTLTQRPITLESTPKKKIVPNLDLLRDEQDDSILANASASSSENDALDSFNDLPTPDDLTTPEAFGDSVFEGELDWEESENSDETPAVEPIPEYTAKEEYEDEKNWRSVSVGDRQFRIDMKVIEPYKKVLSHGGYYGDGFNAIIVFAGCYLPDKRRRDYHYVMDNLFLYVLSTLELLVVEDYMVVYFHGATPKQKMPSLRWLKRCYDMIDRRLKKNLKSLLIVHPTLWIRTIMTLTKPFISSKFSSKLKYVRSLKDLEIAVPMEYIFVPDEIKMFDAAKFRQNPPSPTAT